MSIWSIRCLYYCCRRKILRPTSTFYIGKIMTEWCKLYWTLYAQLSNLPSHLSVQWQSLFPSNSIHDYLFCCFSIQNHWVFNRHCYELINKIINSPVCRNCIEVNQRRHDRPAVQYWWPRCSLYLLSTPPDLVLISHHSIRPSINCLGVFYVIFKHILPSDYF